MKKSKTVWGTSYFATYTMAREYYAQQGDSREQVDTKIREGSIHIGVPPLKKNQKLIYNSQEGRYFIEG